jgi:hypothetical protein
MLQDLISRKTFLSATEHIATAAKFFLLALKIDKTPFLLHKQNLIYLL